MKIKKQLIRASASISCHALGRTVSRFLFYSAIYLLDLPPGKERAALLSLRTLRYTWSFWSWCRHHYMSPYNVVSSCLAVSPLPFGGLFSVTAFIRLLPSVLSTAGCPFQSGLSSGVTRGKCLPPVALRRQPRGACGLHVVQTGDLSSFRLLRRHGPGRDGWCRPGIPITSVLNQRQIVLPCFVGSTCYTFTVKT